MTWLVCKSQLGTFLSIYKFLSSSLSLSLQKWDIQFYPQKMLPIKGKKKIVKRSKIKTFMKVCNYNPSYPQGTLGILLDKRVVKKDVFRNPALKHKWEAKVKSEE